MGGRETFLRQIMVLMEFLGRCLAGFSMRVLARFLMSGFFFGEGEDFFLDFLTGVLTKVLTGSLKGGLYDF